MLIKKGYAVRYLAPQWLWWFPCPFLVTVVGQMTRMLRLLQQRVSWHICALREPYIRNLNLELKFYVIFSFNMLSLKVTGKYFEQYTLQDCIVQYCTVPTVECCAVVYCTQCLY